MNFYETIATNTQERNKLLEQKSFHLKLNKQ